MHHVIRTILFLSLIALSTASITINNGSHVTENTSIPIIVTNGSYILSVDGTNYTFDSNNTLDINSTKGYHNITIDNSTDFYLIYDTESPVITITNLSPTSYHYTQLPIPTVTVTDDNSPIFISQTPINSSAGNHIFSVTALDIANHHSTSSINYTVIANTTVNLTKDTTLILPLMNSTLSFNSTNPVNLSITLPAGFTTPQTSYTAITSLNFTIKSGTSPLDSFVPVSVSYADNYGTSGIIPLQYWLVGNKTVFYLSYDANEDTHISRQEAMNATKTYYRVTSISSDRIKDLITVYVNNQTYIR